ncbi:unnamed protein product, partial [Mesorhabditis belari]|uniref:Uncharacterized protein n=1 Tax=Mesorhabditis belari TaxID=2138241 RepID=A0AAF3FRS0_9BILA
MCPICQSVCLRSKECVKKNNALKNFLRELPEMLKQIEDLEKEGKANDSKDCCENCKKSFSFSQMFSCFDCNEKICGACAFRKHRSHTVVDLIVKEIDKIIDETSKSVSSQISCYKEIFPQLHQDLLDNISMFEKSLLSKISNIKRENIERARKESFDCRKLGDDFELISEKYLPTLREINSNLLDLLNDPNLGFVQVSIFHDSTDPKIEEKRMIEETTRLITTVVESN